MLGENRPAADAAEHARLQKALRESVILRELADILNSSLDLEHILQELVKRTTELCDVIRCAVWLLEETWSSFRPITYHIASPAIAEELIHKASTIWYRSPLSTDHPVIQRLLEADGMLYVEDLRNEPSLQAFAETFQTHSVLLIALAREGRPVGMMSLDNPGRGGNFSQEQQQLARAISQQATIAIDNARLYQQAQAQQQRSEQLIERARAIYQVAMTVNSGAELPVVLRLATQHLVRGLEASNGAAMLLDTDETILRPVDPQDASAGLPASSLSLSNLPNFQQAIALSRPMLLSAEQIEKGERAWFHQFSLKSMLIVPLMVGSGNQDANGSIPGGQRGNLAEEEEEARLADVHCVGLIVVNYSRRRKPTRGQYAFAQDIAAQCALAIEKARLQYAAQQAAALEQARWQQEALSARASEAAMREADALKNEFLAITAHEFRNPLAVIQGHSQGALRSLRKARKAETASSSAIEEHLEIIATQTKQLNNIISTFLDAARLNRGQIALKNEVVDLEKIARQVIEGQAHLLENHELRCIAPATDVPYLVLGDQARLAQIVTNLVENAIKYSPLGGPVTITLSHRQLNTSPALIEVCVEDRGTGIPPEAQAMLFERFYRVPSAISNETRGVGLGLYIVAQLVRMHGGDIHVESSGLLGEGSRFIFTLPTLTPPMNCPQPDTHDPSSVR
ncbi:MAG TPA: GAF domain-containing sensor histidine kinase [Ktedonobacteraceae bacterium]|nr:GAF domain-containing sensor histidine kinase [Ktedonobacteraceae bacterium]